eukprot:638124_1
MMMMGKMRSMNSTLQYHHQMVQKKYTFAGYNLFGEKLTVIDTGKQQIPSRTNTPYSSYNSANNTPITTSANSPHSSVTSSNERNHHQTTNSVVIQMEPRSSLPPNSMVNIDPQQ